MIIRYGFCLNIEVCVPTPVLIRLDVHPTRTTDILDQTALEIAGAPAPPATLDVHGNLVRRFLAEPGETRLSMEGLIGDPGVYEPQLSSEPDTPIAQLPDECLVYLLGSRYCETDLIAPVAWQRFGHLPAGAQQVRAIVDFVHHHLTFGYEFARPTRTALEALNEGVGVCRDFTHLTVALCRAMNIPARYVNGFLGDIGVPRNPAPMDFSAWAEVFVNGRWFNVDARHNTPRIGRIVIARGRDAADVPMLHSFGPHILKQFSVVTEEAPQQRVAA